jgi:hypothetical protein
MFVIKSPSWGLYQRAALASLLSDSHLNGLEKGAVRTGLAITEINSYQANLAYFPVEGNLIPHTDLFVFGFRNAYKKIMF